MLTAPRLHLLAPLALLSLGGCGGITTGRHVHYDYGYAVSSGWGDAGRVRWQESVPQAPRLSIDQTEVDHAFASLAAKRQAQAENAALLAPTPSPRVEVATREVEAAWALAQRERADGLIAAHPGLMDLDEATRTGAVTVACEYVSQGTGGRLHLTLERGPAAGSGPLAVCVSPGTYGVPVEGAFVADVVEGDMWSETSGNESERGSPWIQPRDERRFGHWPSPQDLALLRARVITLEAGQTGAQVTFPVACAAFSKGCPQSGQVYQLERLPVGSPLDRLLVALCADELQASEAEVQLAVWMARNDLTWHEFVAEGGHWGRLLTFGRNESVLPEHAAGAARILLDSGVDPRACTFFGGPGGAALTEHSPALFGGDGGEAAPAPAPAPEPTPPPAEAKDPVVAEAELAS